MEFSKYSKSIMDVLESVETGEINKFIDMLIEAYEHGKYVFVIGNGGSAANASHLAQDFAKGTRQFSSQTKRLKALSLTDNTPFITAQGNDEGYDSIFEPEQKPRSLFWRRYLQIRQLHWDEQNKAGLSSYLLNVRFT